MSEIENFIGKLSKDAKDEKEKEGREKSLQQMKKSEQCRKTLITMFDSMMRKINDGSDIDLKKNDDDHEVIYEYGISKLIVENDTWNTRGAIREIKFKIEIDSDRYSHSGVRPSNAYLFDVDSCKWYVDKEGQHEISTEQIASLFRDALAPYMRK